MPRVCDPCMHLQGVKSVSTNSAAYPVSAAVGVLDGLLGVKLQVTILCGLVVECFRPAVPRRQAGSNALVQKLAVLTATMLTLKHSQQKLLYVLFEHKNLSGLSIAVRRQPTQRH